MVVITVTNVNEAPVVTGMAEVTFQEVTGATALCAPHLRRGLIRRTEDDVHLVDNWS